MNSHNYKNKTIVISIFFIILLSMVIYLTITKLNSSENTEISNFELSNLTSDISEYSTNSCSCGEEEKTILLFVLLNGYGGGYGFSDAAISNILNQANNKRIEFISLIDPWGPTAIGPIGRQLGSSVNNFLDYHYEETVDGESNIKVVVAGHSAGAIAAFLYKNDIDTSKVNGNIGYLYYDPPYNASWSRLGIAFGSGTWPDIRKIARARMLGIEGVSIDWTGGYPRSLNLTPAIDDPNSYLFKGDYYTRQQIHSWYEQDDSVLDAIWDKVNDPDEELMVCNKCGDVEIDIGVIHDWDDAGDNYTVTVETSRDGVTYSTPDESGDDWYTSSSSTLPITKTGSGSGRAEFGCLSFTDINLEEGMYIKVNVDVGFGPNSLETFPRAISSGVKVNGDFELSSPNTIDGTQNGATFNDGWSLTNPKTDNGGVTGNICDGSQTLSPDFEVGKGSDDGTGSGAAGNLEFIFKITKKP